MLNYLSVLALFVVLAFSSTTKASEHNRIEILVGMGERPPFLFAEDDRGAGPDILQAMNLTQNKFVFIPKKIPTRRRQQAFEELWVDIVMWDNPIWDWGDQQLEKSLPLIHSRDIYIAKRSSVPSPKFFDDMKKMSIAIVNGYQYNLFNFETDINQITKAYDVIQARTEEAAIKLLLVNRAKIAIISQTSVNWFIKSNGLSESIFAVAPFVDSTYARYFLIPKSAPISSSEINDILHSAQQKGLLAPIYRRYGLPLPKFKQ